MAVYEDMLAAKQREREAAARQEAAHEEARDGAGTDAGAMTLEEALRLGLVTLAPGTGQPEQQAQAEQQPEQAVQEQPEQPMQQEQPVQPAPVQPVPAEQPAEEPPLADMEDDDGPAEVVRAKRKRTRHHSRRNGAERREAGPADAIEDLSAADETAEEPDAGAMPEVAPPEEDTMPEAVAAAEDAMPEAATAPDELARAAAEEDEALRSILSESMAGHAASVPEEAFADAPGETEEPGLDYDGEEFPADGAEGALAGLSADGTPDAGPDTEGIPDGAPAMDGSWQGQDADAEDELLGGSADEGYPWEDGPDGTPGDGGFPDGGPAEYFDAPEDPDVWEKAESLAVSVVSGGGAYAVSDGVRDAAVRILQDAISDLGGTVSERVITEAFDAVMEIQQAVIEANSRYISAQRDLMCATDGMTRRREDVKKAMERYDRLVGKAAGRTD